MGAGESGAAPFGQTRRELASDATPSHYWEWFRRAASPAGKSATALLRGGEYVVISGAADAALCAMDLP